MDAVQRLDRSRGHMGYKAPATTEALTAIDIHRIRISYSMLSKLSLYSYRVIMRAMIEGGPMSVTDILCAVARKYWPGVEQSEISMRLSFLRRYRIVTVEKRGKFHIYTIDQDRLRIINGAIHRFIHP